jgi:4-amino-4-deoxy-L-arabinose transferase-like glycosyltransferase
MVLKNLRNKNSFYIISLFLLSFLARLLFPPKTPINGDEAVYATIIDEFTKMPTLLPNFLGHPISWKPPLTFIVYSVFIKLFNLIIPSASPEFTYRLPSLIFSILSTLTFYFLVKRLSNDNDDLAYLSALIFSTFPVFLFTSSFIFVDNLLVFLILLSLLLYVDGEKNKKYFYYAGLVAALAFWVKTFLSFMVPIIIIAYYYKNKKVLFSKEFLISLALLPIGAFLYTLLFYTLSPKGYDIISSYLYDSERVLTPLSLGSIAPSLLFYLSPWIFIAIFSPLKVDYRKRENRMMLVWSFFTILTIFKPEYFWYYAVVTPAFAFLSANTISLIKNKNYANILFFALLYVSLAIYASLEISYNDSNPAIPYYYSEKQTGQFLQNKSNIFILTDIAPSGLIFYKFHGEEKPNFKGINMTVTAGSPFLAYILYDTVTDQVKNPEKKEVVVTNGTSIKNAILESSVNDYVVLDKNNYEMLLNDFPQYYKVVFNSINMDFTVLERIR